MAATSLVLCMRMGIVPILLANISVIGIPAPGENPLSKTIWKKSERRVKVYYYPGVINPTPRLKTTYYKLASDLGLIVAAGFYHPGLDGTINAKKRHIFKSLTYDILMILTMNFLAIGIILLFVRRFSTLIDNEFRIFTSFFTLASSTDMSIQTEELKYKEFKVLAKSANQMIEKRKIAEQELLESERLRRHILQSAKNVALIMTDATSDELQIMEISYGGEEIFQYHRDELVGQSLVKLHHTADRTKIGLLQEDLVFQKAGISQEMQMVRKNGDIFPAYMDIQPVFNNMGKLIHFVVMYIDITSRKQSEVKLAQETERLMVTLRSIGEGVIVTNLKGDIELINRVAEELTDSKNEEIHSRPIESIISFIDHHSSAVLPNPVRQVIQSKSIVNIPGEVDMVSHNGKRHQLAISAAPIRDIKSEIIGVVLVFRDITVSKRAEEELFKVKTLESIGVLASYKDYGFSGILVKPYIVSEIENLIRHHL